MSPGVFVISMTILLIVIIIRKNIANFLNESIHFPYQVKTEYIVYVVTAIFIVVMTLGMIMGTTKNFSNMSVGGGIENLNSSPDKKPHRLFNINFDIFNF